MKRRTYGLITAITMITGIIIGSGIFFKSDDILAYANGNVLVGVILWCVAAVAVVFGAMTIAQLATRTDKPGGVVTYAEDFVGMGTSCMFGWFETFLYMPSLTAILSWVCGTFVCQLFGWQTTVLTCSVIGFVIIVALFFFNALSAKLGGTLQNATMFIKLIPLLVLAVCGLIFGDTGEVVADSSAAFGGAMGVGILAAFAPLAFSFDGWIISTSICHEIRNSKRNLPLALMVAPLIILVLYVAYFVGISAYLGPEQVMALGNEAPYAVAQQLFGPVAAKIVLVMIVISVLGTVNGVVLGIIRMPYSLALRNMMPFANKQLAKTNDKFGGMPVNSALFTFALSLVWLVVNHFWLGGGLSGDVSEIAIGMSYVLYIILYVAVIRMGVKGEIKNKFYGIVAPILAIVGALVIVSGSVSMPLFPYYLLICVIILGGAYLYYAKHKDIIKPTEPMHDED